MAFPSDLEIAQRARLAPLADVAATMGIGGHLLEPHGESVAKIRLEAIEELADRPKAKYVVVSAVTPTPLGEGKTTTTVGLGQAFQHIGRSADHRPAPALDGPDLRDQGWRRGRRLQPGGADGAAQPPPDRRLPRRHRGAQPARRDPGQPPAPGQLARHRSAQHHLAAGARRQRPRSAEHRDRAGGPAGRRHPADRVRHHRGLGGDGAARAGDVARRTCKQRLRRIVVGYTRAGRAGHRRGPPGRRARWPPSCARRSSRTCCRPSSTPRSWCTPVRSATSPPATPRSWPT